MILVFGSINLDIVTRVPGIPRPGETVKGDSYQLVPGGKGANQALAVKRAGVDCAMVGAVGQDGFADLALSALQEAGVDLSAVNQSEEPTGIASIAVEDSGENAIAVASGANATANSAQLQSLSGTHLLTQQEVPDAEVWAAHRWAKSHGVMVLHNAAPASAIPTSALETIDWLVVNEIEAQMVAEGADLDVASADPMGCAKVLSDAFHMDVIVTLGADGARSFGPSGVFAAQSLPVDVKDTTAAGDTFAGVFAAGLSQGFSVETALQRAAIAGSLACTVHGAQPSIPLKSAIDFAAN